MRSKNSAVKYREIGLTSFSFGKLQSFKPPLVRRSGECYIMVVLVIHACIVMRVLNDRLLGAVHTSTCTNESTQPSIYVTGKCSHRAQVAMTGPVRSTLQNPYTKIKNVFQNGKNTLFRHCVAVFCL